MPKSQFLGVHMSDSSSTGKRPTVYSKMVPNIDPTSRKMGVCFQHFFDAALEPCFHYVVSKIGSKMVPKKLPFLRPLTLLKCSKYQPYLTFPGPGEGTFFRSLFGTPPEHPFCRFWSTFGVHLGTLWNHFFNTFFDLIFRPPFEPQKKPVLASEREAR